MTPELYQSGPPFSIDGINFQPIHPVPLKEEGVFIPAQTHQNLEEEAHLNGYRSEQRVGNIVAHIDSVKEVKQVEPHGTEDRQRIDLVVTMVDGFPIDQVFIQVKSGYGSVAAFFDDDIFWPIVETVDQLGATNNLIPKAIARLKAEREAKEKDALKTK